MEEAAGEVALGSRLRILSIAAGISIAVVAVIHLYILLAPQLIFSGLVNGYASLTSYSLRYNHNGEEIRLVHTDYVSHVSAALVYTLAALLVISIASTSAVALNRGSWKPISILYGVSSALVVSSGVLRYLTQAFEADTSFLVSMNSNGRAVRLETSAGVIEYIGLFIQETPAYRAVFREPIVVALPAIVAVALSTAAEIVAIVKLLEQPATYPGEEHRRFTKKVATAPAPAAILILILTLNASASVYVYYPARVTVKPVPPPALLTAPPHPYTCQAVTRTLRGALTYTDFESTPAGWASRGGSWSIVSPGHKGNAIRGIDYNNGVGGASQFYWSTRVDGYRSLWVAEKVYGSPTGTYKGIALINTDFNRLYEISIYINRVDVWSYGVENPNGWRRLGSATISGFSPDRWYTVVLNYTDTGTAIVFYVWVYDPGGREVASLTVSSTSGRRFRPAYIGLEVDGATATFDDFVISTRDPRTVVFTGLYPGMVVEVWDNLGGLVNRSVGVGSVWVVSDVVAGTGVDGSIVARYPDGFACIRYSVPLTDAIVGGDVYRLVVYSISTRFGANRTSAGVTTHISTSGYATTFSRVVEVSTTQTLYARLILAGYTAPPVLHLDLWLMGVVNSTRIVISGGVAAANSTNRIALRLGGGNYIALSGYYTATGYRATLNLLLELCTHSDGLGACVYYPIVAEILGNPSSQAVSGVDGSERSVGSGVVWDDGVDGYGGASEESGSGEEESSGGEASERHSERHPEDERGRGGEG